MLEAVQQIHAGPFSPDSLFSGSLSLAGLVLVFLGIVLTAFNSFATEDQNAVRTKYRCQAILTFLGFLSCMGSALLALIADIFELIWALPMSLAALVASMALTTIASFLVLGEMKG